jgi:hypothetical protein
MAVTLINVFIVPADREIEFLSTWKETTRVFSATPNTGFIETHLHKNTGIGNSTFSFINIASWESPGQWKTAHDNYKPKEYLIPGVKGHPSIFECVVDVFGVGKEDTGKSFLRVPEVLSR